MGEILNAGMQWRGYNTPDPNNSYVNLTGNAALTQTFTQTVNRVVIHWDGTALLYVKFGGTAAAADNYDLVIPSAMGFAGGINTNAVSVFTTYGAVCYIGGFREDNTGI